MARKKLDIDVLSKDPELIKLLAEIERRESRPKWDIKKILSPKQIAFFEDKSRWKVACCGRRAGKTFVIATSMIDSCLNTKVPESKYVQADSIYITLSRATAKRNIWNPILKLVDQYEIPVYINNADMVIKFLDTGNSIHVTSVADSSHVAKFRGFSCNRIFIDEAQDFGDYIDVLVNEVLVYLLQDWDDGQIILTGTPGPVKFGLFYQAAAGDGLDAETWSRHHWISKDNPHTNTKTFYEDLRRRGLDHTNPKFIREALGLWSEDSTSLVFKFKQERNTYVEESTKLPGNMNYVMGIDVGTLDDNAIAILGYSDNNPTVYLIEEVIIEEPSLTNLMTHIKALDDKYKPLKRVIDYSSGGSMVIEDMRQRWGVALQAAQKDQRDFAIDALNAALLSGHFLVPDTSRCSLEMRSMEWSINSNGKRSIPRGKSHSDIAFAVLYAWRECKAYNWIEEDKIPAKGTVAYADYEAEKLFEEEVERSEEQRAIKSFGFDEWSDFDIQI